MTVSSEINRDDYSGNGVTTVFTVNFRFLANSHVRVIHADSSGVETTWVETTDYTLTGAGNPTGTLTAIVAPASGESLTFLRDVPQTQEVDYVENDTFPAETHEGALDKLTMQVQQQDEKFDRLIQLPESEAGTNLTFESPIANNYLQWKSDLSGLQNVAIVSAGTLTVTPYIETLLDDNNAQEAITTLGFTGTSAEWNILDGVTATTAELNYNDITTLGTVELSKTVTADSNGNINFPSTKGIGDANGNEAIRIGVTTDANAEITVTNGVDKATIAATGDNADVDLNISSKGDGYTRISGSPSATSVQGAPVFLNESPASADITDITTSTINWTTVDLASLNGTGAKVAILRVYMIGTGSGGSGDLFLAKSGQSGAPSGKRYSRVRFIQGPQGANGEVTVPLDENQDFQYAVLKSSLSSFDMEIRVIGYYV